MLIYVVLCCVGCRNYDQDFVQRSLQISLSRLTKEHETSFTFDLSGTVKNTEFYITEIKNTESKKSAQRLWNSPFISWNKFCLNIKCVQK